MENRQEIKSCLFCIENTFSRLEEVKMLIFNSKYLAMLEMLSDEVVVRVEDGWTIIPRKHYKRWKRR